MSSAPSRGLGFGRACIRAAAWAWLLAGTGCVTAPSASVSPGHQVAHVAVTNLTDYTWNIAVRAVSAAEPRAWRVPPRGSVELELAGGDYEFEQTIVSTHIPLVAAMRRFPARFVSGERYAWSLVTVLAMEPAEGLSPPAKLAR